MKIIIDTREQTPWSFPDGVLIERGTLATGDYTLAGLENIVAVERKSLADFISCCGKSGAVSRKSSRGYADIGAGRSLSRGTCGT